MNRIAGRFPIGIDSQGSAACNFFEKNRDILFHAHSSIATDGLPPSERWRILELIATTAPHGMRNAAADTAVKRIRNNSGPY